MDVAALALNIDSSSVVKAANDLDRFSAAAAKAGSSSGSNTGSIAKLVATVQSMDAKLSSIIGGLEKIAGAMGGAAASAQKMAAANDNVARSLGAADSHVNAYRDHLRGLASAQQNANAHVLAFRAHMVATAPVMQQADAHVAAYRSHLASLPPAATAAAAGIDRVGKAVATSAGAMRANTGNIAAQFQDIGVTAAMGMSPLIIGLQQGTQLSAALAQSGGGALATLRAAFASVLSPVALVTIALVAGAAALIQWASSTDKTASAAYRAENGLKTYTKAMGYTKEEVKKLNAVTVTMGDTVQAVFQVGWARAAEALGISTDQMTKTWSGFLDWLGTATRATIAGVYAAIAGTLDLKQNIVDDTMSGDLGWGTFTKGYSDRYAQAQRFLTDVGKQARVNARARQDEMARGMFDKPKGSGGKTDAEKLADIYAGAQADIAAEKAREFAAANELGAYEVARLEKQASLLNEVQRAGIPVTAAVTQKIAELAEAYAKFKTSADVSEVVNATTLDIQQQADAIANETRLIGLRGEAYERMRREIEAERKLREALPKGEIYVTGNLTGGLSDAIEANARSERIAKLKNDADDARYAMDLERQGLGLTGAAALEYAYVTERLNEAKRAGREMHPEEMAAIEEAGAAYGRQRHAIDQQRRALEDSREVTRGFFSDWINGVREGQDIFKSFADSVVNSLNRIIDKLLDRTLDTFLDGMFQGGSSGGFLGGLFGGKSNSLQGSGGVFGKPPPMPGTVFPYALGGMFDQAQRFAKGGTFTNQVVSAPTLFRFAKGAKLGEMGENGPEGILPLKRGPNGALGVQAHGGGRPSVQINTPITIAQSGSFTTEDARALAAEAGQAAVQEVKRNLDAYLREWDIDGAVST